MVLSRAFNLFIHGFLPYTIFRSFFKGWWNIYFRKKYKTKNEFIISTLYKSCKRLVFHGNKLANVRSEDVVLLGLLAGICCTLGVLKIVACHAEGGTIVCVAPYGAFLGVEAPMKI